MTISYRLTMMFVSLAIIVLIGWWGTGTFQFVVSQFWFISGALLLILLTLVDQPHFSKDANVFGNGTAAWVSLFSVQGEQRTSLWWIFFAWATYLIASSFVLMIIRSRELVSETKAIQLCSRVNRVIGRPESVFSAFLLWGIFLQFAYPHDTSTINALLLFWAVFMILNVPAIAQTVSSCFDSRDGAVLPTGIVTGIQSPRLATVQLSPKLPENIVGKQVDLQLEGGGRVATGTLFEDRIVQGLRQGRVALTSFQSSWSEISLGGKVELSFSIDQVSLTRPVGVVSAGSSIGRLVFEVDPRSALHEGEIVKVNLDGARSYYQIVGASITDENLAEGNASQCVRVNAGQLGLWNSGQATFDPIDWVPPAGELVVLTHGDDDAATPPTGRCIVGYVPNSRFPIHVHISDIITHNSALIGVTGSGKSYLAFHLIESYLDSGVNVLILDITRQHCQFLQHRNPLLLTGVPGIAPWLSGSQKLAIYHFDGATEGFPKVTADLVAACLQWMQTNVRLQAGADSPARLCVVFEEAHSLIPEWNQVAQQSDVQQVNRAARIVLQGRKFGLGTLLITQRTANVTKTILNQCNTIFALRSFDQTGLDFLRNYMGEEYSQAISTLPQQTAILVGKASSSARPIIFKVSDLANRWKNNVTTSSAEPSS